MIGEQRVFAYPTEFITLPDYSAHRGQIVTVLEELADGEEVNYDPDSDERMFRFLASDGWIGVAWSSELHCVL